ncbi:MAG: SWIM zinc finger family protein, partial [Candidatus Eisenbacteria sp.]|nr:SWIM zinc finger family protein [Candidatus Eisenbacteria bacterium]
MNWEVQKKGGGGASPERDHVPDRQSVHIRGTLALPPGGTAGELSGKAFGDEDAAVRAMREPHCGSTESGDVMHNRAENRVENRVENTWDKLELSLEDLFDLASQAVTRRGLSYARAGRVTDLVAVNGRLEARVAGGRSMPYLVVLEYDGEEILSTCTCPFDWEPFCKHAIAALAVQFALVGEQIDPAAELPSLEREEVEVRRRRGGKGGFRITRREGDSFFGIFDVHSPSERTYTDEIRSLAQRLNRCSCRDFASATLGTCKHIEATLAVLRKRHSKRAFERAAAAPPTIAQVLVDQRDRPRI